MTKYARIENSKVEELFETDGDIETMFPDTMTWVAVPKKYSDVGYGWGYDGSTFTAPVVDYKAIADAEVNSGLFISKEKISIWQSKLLLGIASDDEKKWLSEWISYIDELNNINTSLAPEIEWPKQPDS